MKVLRLSSHHSQPVTLSRYSGGRACFTPTLFRPYEASHVEVADFLFPLLAPGLDGGLFLGSNAQERGLQLRKSLLRA